VDERIIHAKLESLRLCLSRIRDKTPASVGILSNDIDLQDIISVNLERAVQVCVDIAAHIISESDEGTPASMGESFDSLHSLGIISQDLSLRMKKAVGFRNISVHAYQAIDWEIVYAIITTRLDDFTSFATSVTDTLDESG
jgi:uncharacterized protein YutE (UPF0331/DUF86 family)